MVDHLFGDLMERGQLEGSNRDVHIGKFANNWLHLRVIDAVKRFYYLQIVLLLLIFHYCRLYWSKVLLVAKIDVIEEGTLAGEERTGKFKRLGVPKLAFLLLLGRFKRRVFLHLNYEANLCRVAEVTDCEATNFLNERLSGQF